MMANMKPNREQDKSYWGLICLFVSCLSFLQLEAINFLAKHERAESWI